MIIVKIKNLRINLTNLAGYRPVYTGDYGIYFYLHDEQVQVCFESQKERNEALNQMDAISQEYAIQYLSLLNKTIDQTSTPQIREVA
jgi:hypothetical protein